MPEAVALLHKPNPVGGQDGQFAFAIEITEELWMEHVYKYWMPLVDRTRSATESKRSEIEQAWLPIVLADFAAKNGVELPNGMKLVAWENELVGGKCRFLLTGPDPNYHRAKPACNEQACKSAPSSSLNSLTTNSPS